MKMIFLKLKNLKNLRLRWNYKWIEFKIKYPVFYIKKPPVYLNFGDFSVVYLSFRKAFSETYEKHDDQYSPILWSQGVQDDVTQLITEHEKPQTPLDDSST